MSDDEKLRDYLKRVTAGLRQAQQRLREMEEREQEPLAVVAMGCRFPGGVACPEDLWEMVRSGMDAISAFPADRNWEPGDGRYVPLGGFVYDAGEFDAGFFGISPREALAMDPQQRLLLEVCWEVLERAGINPASLRGSPTGVFVGASYTGYGTDMPGFMLTGLATSVISGRVSYTLGLEGPAVSVDTACSSSLVALHLACQALRSGECDLALAGGVTVMITPAAFTEFDAQGGLAADGRCKAFAAGADGIGWAEGAGVLLVERLSDARRNGHPVLALVTGSAVNQDGASNGLTAPNGPSQQRVIWQALANARMDPGDVDAVEAHGTGTVLGDPIEAQALIATYGQNRDSERPLWLGSVKSNIGHAQCAAGVAGVIKMVMALQAGVLPRTLHAAEPSPHVDWSAGSVRLLTQEREWPQDGRPRRAGVSSFGVSGTNAHMILQQAQEPADHAGDQVGGRAGLVAGGVVPWMVSGRGEAALRGQAGRLAEFARSGCGGGSVLDAGWSLASGRAMFEDRAVVLAGDPAGFAAGLEAAATGQAAAGVIRGRVPDEGAGKTVFVFPGQGGQWAGMAAGLGEFCPVFAERLGECAAALQPHVDWPVAEMLADPDEDALEATEVVQPLLWAVMVALAAAWQELGVVPDAVAGHSQGEIAAATVAGVLSLQDAARVVAVRSRAVRRLAGSGAMVSVAWPVQTAEAASVKTGGRVWVAAVNSPSSVVLAGDRPELEQVVARAEAGGARVRWLPVDYASHGPAVDEVAAEVERDLAGIAPRPGRIPFWSAVTAQAADGTGLNEAYWTANLRQRVRFEQVIRALARAGHGVFVEASPHPVLVTAMQQTLEDAGQQDAVSAGTLRRDAGGPGRLLASAAELFVRGVPVDWAAVFAESGARRVGLPTYAFQHQRYWPAPPAGGMLVAGGDGAEAGFWAAVEREDIAGLAGAVGVQGDAPLSAVLPVLASWRRRRRRESAVDRWRYQVSWQPVTAPAERAVLVGRWLLVAPAAPAEAGSGLAAACAGALAEGGAQVMTVTVGAGLGRAELAGVLRAVVGSTAGGVAGVVSLLAVDEGEQPGCPGVAAGLAGTLVLVQALGDAGITARLWVLTCGGVPAGAERSGAVGLGQAMVWGLGRVAALEYPGRWGGLVDVPGQLTGRAAGWLRAVLAAAGGEDQVAIGPAGVLARRLVRAPAVPAVRSWRPSGPVLLTGATGKLGPLVARWLAGRGAPRVILVSRRGLAAEGAAGLAARVSAAGAAVTVAACDVADREDLSGLLIRLAAAGTRVRGVVHAAMAGTLTALDQLSVTELAEVCRAKAAGAACLDELLGGDVDTFVLFSSIAGVWGSGNHGAYAAANAYLDALAHDRRARGLPATSVPWGVWRPGRYAGDGGGLADSVIRQGLALMVPERALAGLQQVLDGDEVCTAVAEVNWERFAPVFTSGRPSPLLTGVPEARQVLEADTAATAPGQSELAGRLAGLPPAEQERILLQAVCQQAATVLGHSTAEPVRPGAAFRDLGFDSLTALELRDKLNAVTGLRLPATLVFDYPTPRVLAGWLRARIAGSPAVISAPSAGPAVTSDPVAVVAMGCRYPGGVAGPEDLWELVRSGGDAVSGFPADRGWEETAGEHAYAGGFVPGVADFDAGFFGISPREALAMDPQQRLLLEVCWEAFERAGIDPHTLRGSRTGVFAGTNGQTYGGLLALAADSTEGYAVTGTASSVVSGRVAYSLGLEGPAVSVDTACSSSLVALHLACQALRTGECDLALAGGVMVMATPGVFGEFAAQGGLAADGRCKAFGAGADGMGLAEGAGVLLVERLSDARQRGHPVLALVTGSAVNQDGASNGLTAPNGPSQQRVIRAALAAAGLGPDEVDAVEAHGTGTRLGDPLEAQALIATYGPGRDAQQPLWLGSVKSNIGHAQAAAGAAGLIKMVMSLQHRVLPPTLHAEPPSPHVDWSAGTVRLLTGEQPWPQRGRPARAGVSAFGISGTNAHVILEQAPVGWEPVVGDPPAGDDAENRDGTPAGLAAGVVPWVLSGRGEAGLRGQAGRLAGWARSGRIGRVADTGWSLATGRAMLEDRAVVLAADPPGFAAALEAIAAGRPAGGVVTGRVPDGDTSQVVFVFPGQGGQWAGMAAGLAGSCPAFAERLGECAAALAPHVDWPVAHVLASTDEQALERAEVVQPVLWAVMVALAAAWESVGVTPDAVAGHSQGEIAAATVAGILPLADAARVVAVRSRAVGRLAGDGAMVSVAWPARTAEAAVAQCGVRVWVAAVNSPSQVVLAGNRPELERVVAVAEAAGTRVRWLPVDYASHGPAVDAVAAQVARDLAGITPQPGPVPFWSSVTGELTGGTALDGEYWAANLRRQVRFSQAIRGLAGAGHQVFIEASPHPVLTAAVEQTLQDAGVPDAFVAGTLRRDDGGPGRLLTSAAEVFVRGVPVDWAGVFSGCGARRVTLPTYAFQHQRYWPGVRARAGDVAGAGLMATGHPLLAARVGLAGEDGVVFTGRLSVAALPWLADHALFGTVLMPGAAVAEMAVWAGGAVGCGQVAELVLEAPLVLPGEGGVRVQLRIAGPGQDGSRAVNVYSRPDDPDDADDPGGAGWVRHASGALVPGERAVPAEMAGMWPPEGAVPVPLAGFYELMAEAGYGYGPAFRGLAAAWRHEDEVFAEVRLPDGLEADAARFTAHPALLDAALHPVSLIAAFSRGPDETAAGTRGLVPFSWNGVQVAEPGARMLRVWLRPAGPAAPYSGTSAEPGTERAFAVLAADEAGRTVLSVEQLVLRPVSADQLRAARPNQRDALLATEWLPVARAEAPSGQWSVLGGEQAALDNLTAAGLAATGLADLATLSASEPPVPPVVAAWLPGLVPGGCADDAEAVRVEVNTALALVQEWLGGDEFAGSVLVLVTRGAVAAEPGDEIAGPAGAGVWGLVRSVQAENPGRFVLADVDGSPASWQALAGAAGCGEPEVAIRQGRTLGRRLVRAAPPHETAPPQETGGAGGPWRLDAAGDGTLGGVRRVAAAEAGRPLEAGQVRIAVRAAGLNFRDALITLGTYPDPAAVIGSEGAGIVTQTGPGVTSVQAGDRVLGIWAGGLGPVAIADERMVAKIPAGWSFTQAASVPVVFATAYYGLVDLAGLRAGESVLIHAAAGGVGMAAVQLARHLGAQVFATASPGKQQAVADLGVDPARIASSRDTQFAARFRDATGGCGVDVVLESAAGEFVDASLGLVAEGGRFIEMGKADVRDPAEVAGRWPAVTYRAFDLAEAGPGRMGQILAVVLGLFARGVLQPLPVRCWELGRTGEALRFMGQGRHVGKNVVRVPVPLDRSGTVLVTGAPGVLGELTARHLAATGRAGLLMLASRRGPAAPGAAALAAAVAGAGAEVQIAVCDTTDKAALAGLLGQVPATHPLAGVIHAAGVLDDGVVTALTPDRVDRVLRPKADAAIALDELTADAGLAAFVLFSSASATFGSPGQGNYAAANAVLDAVAQRRRARGMPAVSIAWGMWQQATGLTAHLTGTDRRRVGAVGAPLTTAQGLDLFDAALDSGLAAVAAVNVDLPGLRAYARSGMLSPLWRGLAGHAAAVSAAVPAAGTLRQELTGLTEAEQDRVVLDLVREQAAAVLGHPSADSVRPGAAFRDLGFDSLTAIELRNRLAAAAGLRLPATLAFDHPTPQLLATWLRAAIGQDEPGLASAPSVLDELDRLQAVLSAVTPDDLTRMKVAMRLRMLLSTWSGSAEPAGTSLLEKASDDEMIDLINKELGRS
jgi:candicidin polyketide synthase FscB